MNTLVNPVAQLQARILARMLRASLLVALVALLLSPPVVAAYSGWAFGLALFWLVWVIIGWWLRHVGRARAAATVLVASTWLTFTVPGLFSAERFSEGNIVASLVIAALLLSRSWVLALGLSSVALSGGAVALDATAYALPVFFPPSNFLRLVPVMLEMSLVAVGLCLVAKELRSATGAGAVAQSAPEHTPSAGRQGEDGYRKLFTHSADASLVLDDGRFIDCNAAALALFGAERNEIIGSDPAEYSPQFQADGQPSQEKAARLINQACREGTARFEWTHLRADGSLIEAEVALTALQLDARTVLHAAVRDATARVHAEAMVVESERRYRSLFESAMDCILVIDPAGRLVDLNHHASATLGFSREELLGESFTRVLDIHLMSRLYPRPADILAEQRSVRGEQELRAKDGTIRVIEFVASPLPDGNVLAVVRDVTERRRAADALRTLNEELEQRVAEQTAELRATNRELESFSYTVSHDLRAPLRAIVGYAALLQADHAEVLAGEPMLQLNHIQQNAKRMKRLIDDLLTFARAARGESVRARVDMRPIVDAAIADHRSLWGQRAIIDVGPLPPVHGDAGMLRQVWSNLVGNALKYTSKEAQPRIRIGAAQTSETTEFWIRDNGVGFDMRGANRLFGVFQRLHSASEFEGTGIGLAIVQRIVERHGGSVRAEGRIGQGATVYFTLPQHPPSGPAQPQAMPPERAQREQGAANPTVLGEFIFARGVK